MSRDLGVAVSAAEWRWREHVEGWLRSGETQRAYCERRGLRVKSLSYWRGELLRREQQRGTAGAPSSGSSVVQWAEVALPSVASSVEDGGLELVHPRGFVVRLSSGFEAAALRRLLIVLESSPC